MTSRPTVSRLRRTSTPPTRTLPIPAGPFGLYGLSPEGFRTLRRVVLEDRRQWRALQNKFRRLWAQLDESKARLDASSTRLAQLKRATNKASRRRRPVGTPA